MSLNNVIDKIVATNGFKNKYNELLLLSVRSQFSSILHIPNNTDLDWGYLITCASLFAKSQKGDILDISFRICQTCITTNNLPQEYHNVCASILNILTNSPAIVLAKERHYISENYLDCVPLHCALDVKKKQFANMISNGNDFICLNDFQKEVYSSYRNSRFLSVSAPTSSGKSFILLQIIKEIIQENNLAKIAYVVPTRALIQQVELDVRKMVKTNDIRVDISSIPIKPDTWDVMGSIAIFTQERLQWLISETHDIVFDILIVDEAQKIGDGARGILLQQVLQQVVHNKSTKIIFASPMSKNPESLLKIVDYTDTNITQSKEIVSELPTVNQNLIWIYKSGTKSNLWSMDLMYRNQRLSMGDFTTNRITKTSLRLPILAYTLSGKQKGNLIYCNGAAEAEKIAVQLMSLIINEAPICTLSEPIKELIKLVKKTIHPNYSLAEVLKAGVAFHYGNMPLNIRNAIEELFKSGEISFLVCTSTLIEGVNLPAKYIYVRGPNKGHNTPMNEMDFWNLAGRAGRQGKEFQGNIICIDADDTTVWKGGTPSERKKYLIKGTVDTIVETKTAELISYIASDDKFINTDLRMDYGYTYFLSMYYRYGTLSKSPFMKIYGENFCRRIDIAFSNTLSKIEIPSSILSKNQGVNPIAQQRLFNYFKSSRKEPIDLIPPFPEDEDAQEKYMHIIGRISSSITNDSSKLTYSRSILITDWMRGYGLARIISDNIKWNKKNKTNKSIASIIRDTMKEIEEYARFRFLKYTTCYIDILKYYFSTIDRKDEIEQIPQLSLWLEFGASQTTQISLMSMGFTRVAALELSELIVHEDYDKSKCLNWLKNNDIHSMDVSPLIMQEVDNVLRLQ